MSETVEWTGLETLITRLSGMADKATDAIANKMEEIVQQGLESMNGLTPVRTGDLLSHNHVQGSGLQVSLTNDSDHAIYVNYGTRKMAAQPFLDPPVVDEVAQAMEKQFPKVLASL